MTLQTVADKVGVSRMTVSNVFSRPDQLSDELRKKILAAAEELGYWGPDPSGRALARGRSGAVGVMLTDSLQHAFTDQFATVLMAAIAGELAPTGLALTLLTAVNPGSARRSRRRARRGDGVLLFGFAGVGRLVAAPPAAHGVHRPRAASGRHLREHRRGGRGAGGRGASGWARTHPHRGR